MESETKPKIHTPDYIKKGWALSSPCFLPFFFIFVIKIMLHAGGKKSSKLLTMLETIVVLCLVMAVLMYLLLKHI